MGASFSPTACGPRASSPGRWLSPPRFPPADVLEPEEVASGRDRVWGVAVSLPLRLVDGLRHRPGLHHGLVVIHEYANHEQEPRLVLEVEKAPVHDGLRGTEPQEEGGGLFGPHHAGDPQPRHVTGYLEKPWAPRAGTLRSKAVLRAQPRPAGLLPVEVAPPPHVLVGRAGTPLAGAPAGSCTARFRQPGSRRTCAGSSRWRRGRRR